MKTPPVPGESPESAAAAFWTEHLTASGVRRWQEQAARKRLVWRMTIRASLALKRGVDIVVSSIALVAASPLFLVTAILIRTEDRGPVFFRQIRIGE